jgi:hypothetical protein
MAGAKFPWALSALSAVRTRPALILVCGMSHWGMTEAAAKIRIVGKAACIRDFAERLACTQQFPASDETRGVIQTNRLDEMAAGRVMRQKELLKVV